MENCIFCKIVKGEIPCAKVYEDEEFLAFLDINPVTKGHIVLLTKEHFTWVQDLPDEKISKVFILSKKIINSLKKATDCEYVQLVVEGIQVPHFHTHLIPSRKDRKNAEWNHVKYEEGEQESYIEKIKSAL